MYSVEDFFKEANIHYSTETEGLHFVVEYRPGQVDTPLGDYVLFMFDTLMFKICRTFIGVRKTGNDTHEDYKLYLKTDHPDFEVVQLTNCLFKPPEYCNPEPPKVYKGKSIGKYKELDELKKGRGNESIRSISALDRTPNDPQLNLTDKRSHSKPVIHSSQLDNKSTA